MKQAKELKNALLISGQFIGGLETHSVVINIGKVNVVEHDL